MRTKLFVILSSLLSIFHLQAETTWKKVFKSGGETFTYFSEEKEGGVHWKLIQDSDKSICYEYYVKKEDLKTVSLLYRVINKVHKEGANMVIWFSGNYESNLVYYEKKSEGSWHEKKRLRIEGVYNQNLGGVDPDKHTVSADFKSLDEIETKTQDGQTVTFKITHNENDGTWSVLKNGNPYDKKCYCDGKVKTSVLPE